MSDFVLVNLGTGFGVGAVCSGNILRGFNNTFGLLGQDSLWLEEFQETDLLDQILCGKGVAKIYKRLCGADKTAESIFESHSSDPSAAKTIDIFVKYLAKCLLSLSFYYNPETIIISGSLKKSAPLYLTRALDLYRSFKHEFVLAKHVIISDIHAAACLGVLALSPATGIYQKRMVSR